MCTLSHFNAGTSPQRGSVYLFMFVCLSQYGNMVILYVCVCAPSGAVDSLIPEVTGIGEGLQLDSRL